MEWNQYTDIELVEGCRQNNRKYQEMLYRKFSMQMYHLCLAYASREEAMDILQESFLKVFRKIDQFRDDGSLGGWIRRIVTNTAIDHFRNNKKSGMNVELADHHFREAAEEEPTDNLQFEDLIRVVDRLPAHARMVFNLYALEGYTHKEIAEKLNIAIGTSKSQFSRARKMLSSYIDLIEEGGKRR